MKQERMNRPSVSAVGRVNEDGIIEMDREAFAKDIRKNFCDKEVIVSVESYYNERSLRQNKYYWGIVVGIFVKCMKEYGNTQLNTKRAHDIFKNKFLSRPVIDVLLPERTIGYETGSTARLSTVEFINYCTDIQNWANSVFQIYIPDPNEEEFFKWIEESPEAERTELIHAKWDIIKQNRKKESYGKQDVQFT